ncbi:unnamed protein product [Gongylonema pulchrum]|uniref:Rab-GAP TBC domain-containing protein n=1 Tax=Gongylonema pulchrum TaxID=637853 RepID=A0A183D653_9BILA|nr:unnamed protein product [Gongylonema pulchrum]
MGDVPTGHHVTFAEEWTEFFGQRVNLERIEKSCLSGRLRGSHVRSIVWRILLKCLPVERDEWLTILARTRNSYAKLKTQLITNPREHASDMDPNVSNPLSLGKEVTGFFCLMEISCCFYNHHQQAY